MRLGDGRVSARPIAMLACSAGVAVAACQRVLLHQCDHWIACCSVGSAILSGQGYGRLLCRQERISASWLRGMVSACVGKFALLTSVFYVWLVSVVSSARLYIKSFVQGMCGLRSRSCASASLCNV